QSRSLAGQANSAPLRFFSALSTAELRELLQNGDKMDQIIRLSEKFQELQVDREMLLTSNRSLAEESLARRPRLNNSKLQLAEKYGELSGLVTTCWEKQNQLGEFTSWTPLCVVLSANAALFVCCASQELLEKFMEGNVSLDQFLDSFQSSRKTYHIRRAQAEKMQEAVQAQKQPSKTKRAGENQVPVGKKDSELPQEPQRPNGFVAQGPLRVFQVRYGLTPAILVPHYPVSPPPSAPGLQSRTSHSESQGQNHILSPSNPLPGHGQPVGLRVIGQLSGGWPANGRPVRVQQLYRPNPQQPEPPYR
uniref:VPS37D subunit of ESCRT-I n=1 Tax=Nothobranchius furzeri TaxID=105023 RepID=A0A8C6KT95_NOTFU